MRRVFSSVPAAAASRSPVSPATAVNGAASIVAALRRVFIQCRDTPNDDCMMFFAPGYEFLAPREGEKIAVTVTVEKQNKHISPLAKRLFRIYGVDEVTIGHNFVTVTRQTEPDLGEGDEGDEGEDETEADIRQRISLTNSSDIEKGKGLVPSAKDAAAAAPTPAESTSATTAASGASEPASPPQKKPDIAPPTSKAAASPPGGGMQVKQHVLPEEEVEEWQPPIWFDLQCEVCAAIADHTHSREPTIELDAPHPHADTIPQEGDNEIVLSIKELLATVIRPEIQKDGGDIRFLTWEESTGEMLVELLGACKTCKSSTTTLADLIERTTRHWIPEVTSVVEANARRKQQQKEEKDAAAAAQGEGAAA